MKVGVSEIKNIAKMNEIPLLSILRELTMNAQCLGRYAWPEPVDPSAVDVGDVTSTTWTTSASAAARIHA